MSVTEIHDFLQTYFHARAARIEPIGAGMFSQACAFVVDAQAYVIRINRGDFLYDVLTSIFGQNMRRMASCGWRAHKHRVALRHTSKSGCAATCCSSACTVW